MAQRIWNMGDRSLEESELGRVFTMGNIQMNACTAHAVWNMGNMSVWDCRLDKVFSFGNTACRNGRFGRLQSFGCVEASGLCQADDVKLSGYASFEYLECKRLCLTGKERKSARNEKTSLEGSIHTQQIEILTPFRLDCEMDAAVWIAGAPLMAADIQCETFYATQSLQVEEINAEYARIVARPDVRIRTLVGSHIEVLPSYPSDKAWRDLKLISGVRAYCRESIAAGIAVIDEIEGDAVSLQNVRAQCVSGTRVHIGDLCVIDRVVCSEEPVISPKAAVGEVICQ